jgi:hypothetical protein
VKVTIEIRMDNAAFDDAPAAELAQILRDLANRIDHDGQADDGPLFDANGNRVGSIHLGDR